MAIDDQTAERAWLLAAYRGENDSEAGLRAVRLARWSPETLRNDPEAVAALAEGDQRQPNDPGRWPDGPPPWKPEVDVDPEATALFAKSQSERELGLKWATAIHQRDKARDQIEFLENDLRVREQDEAAARALERLDATPEGERDFYYQISQLENRNAKLVAELVEGEYGPSPDKEVSEPPANKIRQALLTSDQLQALPPPRPLVDGLVYLNAHALLYAGAGVGKSFLAIDMALHVAHDLPWQGRPVEAGPVLYVVGEGVSGTGQRIAAWQAHHNNPPAQWSIHWLPWAVNLPDPGWSGALAEVVEELQPVLVVIDTYARSTAGADENSAKDTGIIVAHLDHIRAAAGSAVMLVHHSGKDAAAGARGSTALRAAVDTELQLEGDRHNLVLSTRKQKDAPEAEPIHLALTPVAGTDSAVITSSARSEAPAWDGPANCMAAVEEFFAGKPELELSENQAVAELRTHWAARNQTTFRATTVADALSRLELQGVLSTRRGPRKARLYSLHRDYSPRDQEEF
jgi:hypothetical protein